MSIFRPRVSAIRFSKFQASSARLTINANIIRSSGCRAGVYVQVCHRIYRLISGASSRHERDNNNNNDIKIIQESSPVCLLHSKVPIIISAHDLRVVYAWPNLKSALLYVNMAKGDKINNQITSIQLMSIYLATSASRLSSPPQLLILTPLKGPCARYSRCRIKRHCLGWR